MTNWWISSANWPADLSDNSRGPIKTPYFTSPRSLDIRKCGYLRKQKHGHKRFFVLRAAGPLGPSRLEYYDSEKKFRTAAAAPSPPKRVIFLSQCFTVNKRADSKNKYLIALYTKDEYFAIVAESEQEQEDWYVAVSALMSEGKRGHVDSDDLDDGYGTVSPGTVFKEVWQVNVKPKGLGQTKNLTGVYRLCLSAKTVHLVKLNSDNPCVNLQLMNIRRCGHSESFFFIEVGRSSSIGPGEIWMQVDDSVVAQSMHETILETMKALKAFAEFRPRSKSQSSSSNPMPFITTRRHLGNLPPSQTGLQRRSRTESVVGTPPSSKSSGASGYRFRTSSEGEGTMNRPFRSATGSLVHLNSTSGHGSVSDTLTRPSSASICGSPSDGGFNSSDEYGSSPGDFRYFRVRSNTPDSLGNTPPIREESCLNDYMAMGWNRDKMTQTNLSLDEGSDVALPFGAGLLRGGPSSSTSSLRSDYSSCSEHSQQSRPSTLPRTEAAAERPPLCAQEDSGYMPMMCGVAASQRDTPPDYMPMQPSYMMMLPGGGGCTSSVLQASPSPPSSSSSSAATGSCRGGGGENGEYMDMSYSSGHRLSSATGGPPEGAPKSYSPYFSLPRSYKTPTRERDGEYVPMSPPAKPVSIQDRRAVGGSSTSTPSHPPPPYGAHHTTAVPAERHVLRPTRLPLGRRSFHGPLPVTEASTSVAPPSYSEGPSSPGEYINIEFGDQFPHQQQPPAYPLSAPDEETPLGPCCSPPQPQDYMSVEVGGLGKNQSPRPTSNPGAHDGGHWKSVGEDYTDMTFNLSGGGKAQSPTAMLQHLCVMEGHYKHPFSSPVSPPCLNRPSTQQSEPKVERADPQGRRRHSSETFSSTTEAPPPSSAAEAGSGRMCRNTSAGFQNGLNYIALELRGEGVNAEAVASGATGTNGDTAGEGAVPPPENGAYASIDFTKTDGVAAAKGEWRPPSVHRF
uniref:Insulin receptor substrate 2 n=1 Tax=Oryzias sinensis TaxID=183150 RepID=A0A8C8DWL4_9TELE